MFELLMNDEIINKVKQEVIDFVKVLMGRIWLKLFYMVPVQEGTILRIRILI